MLSRIGIDTKVDTMPQNVFFTRNRLETGVQHSSWAG